MVTDKNYIGGPD